MNFRSFFYRHFKEIKHTTSPHHQGFFPVLCGHCQQCSWCHHHFTPFWIWPKSQCLYTDGMGFVPFICFFLLPFGLVDTQFGFMAREISSSGLDVDCLGQCGSQCTSGFHVWHLWTISTPLRWSCDDGPSHGWSGPIPGLHCFDII